jgi:hypothetical protein
LSYGIPVSIQTGNTFDFETAFFLQLEQNPKLGSGIYGTLNCSDCGLDVFYNGEYYTTPSNLDLFYVTSDEIGGIWTFAIWTEEQNDTIEFVVNGKGKLHKL